MKIFLVRHAEGKDFESHWQALDTPLSEKGVKQAKAVVGTRRFKDIDKIYVSNQKRAIETAEIIARGFDKEFQIIDGIEERHQPTEIYGLSRADSLSLKYLSDVSNPANGWDYKWNAEEESFEELFTRAIKFKDFLLENHLGNNVMLVSHSAFLRCFILACILEPDTSSNVLFKLIRAMEIENTGISLLIYREPSKSWKLWYVNDYAHLG